MTSPFEYKLKKQGSWLPNLGRLRSYPFPVFYKHRYLALAFAITGYGVSEIQAFALSQPSVRDHPKNPYRQAQLIEAAAAGH